MATAVLDVFMKAVFGDLKRRARDYGIEQAQCGAVTFIQRFGSALNLNLHSHAVVLDGVYAPKAGGEPEFFPLRAPETSDVLKVVERVAQCATAMLKRRGLAQWPPKNIILLLRHRAAHSQSGPLSFLHFQPEPYSFLRKQLAFTPAELATLESGKIIVNLPKTPETREVAAFAIMRLDIPPDFFVERVRDIVTFKKSEKVLQIGKFSAPPRLADLAGLTFDQVHESLPHRRASWIFRRPETHVDRRESPRRREEEH